MAILTGSVGCFKMDIIEIKTIKLNTLIGVYAWEKKVPQTLVIDIAYGLPERSTQNDALNETIDYDGIIQHIKQFATNHQFQLIETLAEKLVQSLFKVFPTPWIKLCINKPFASLEAKGIILTLERQRISK